MKTTLFKTKNKRTSEGNSLKAYLLGMSDTLEVSGYTSLASSPDVAMAIGKLADIISDATIHLMQNTKDGDVRVRNELAKFLDVHPYSLGTRKTLISWIVQYMICNKDAFVLPVTKSGYLSDLCPMPGAVITNDSAAGYDVFWNGRTFRHDEVLHFPYNPSLSRPWRGRGIEVQLKDILKNLRQASATINGFMSDKWKPSLIVKVDAIAEEFEGEDGRRRLLNEYISNSRAGEPWVIPSDLVDVKEVRPLSLADLALSDSVQLDKRAVASLIRVPPFFCGVGAFSRDEYNYTIQTTVKSIANIITQEMTRKLIISPDMYVRINEWKLYSYGLKELSTVGTELYVRGIASGNEARDLIGWNPVKGLDERVILENYIPAGMIGDQKKLNQGGESNE